MVSTWPQKICSMLFEWRKTHWWEIALTNTCSRPGNNREPPHWDAFDSFDMSDVCKMIGAYPEQHHCLGRAQQIHGVSWSHLSLKLWLDCRGSRKLPGILRQMARNDLDNCVGQGVCRFLFGEWHIFFTVWDGSLQSHRNKSKFRRPPGQEQFVSKVPARKVGKDPLKEVQVILRTKGTDEPRLHALMCLGPFDRQYVVILNNPSGCSTGWLRSTGGRVRLVGLLQKHFQAMSVSSSLSTGDLSWMYLGTKTDWTLLLLPWSGNGSKCARKNGRGKQLSFLHFYTQLE